MAVNLHLTGWHTPHAPDGWERAFVGWREDLSDQELWDLNRGIWFIGERAEQEAYGTLSYKSKIRVVARLTGPRELVQLPGGQSRALVGEVLLPGDPVRETLVGRRVVGRYVSYPDTSDVEGDDARRVGNAFLLIHNPYHWEPEPDAFAAAVATTHAGGTHTEPWFVGTRTHGVDTGDRVFLLRLGPHGRGLVGSGRISGQIFPAKHWDGSGDEANYVPVDWDMLLEPEQRLDIVELEKQMPAQAWHPRAAGTRVRPTVLAELEELWVAHLSTLGLAATSGGGGNGVAGGGHGGGQGWLDDPVIRKAVENSAQARLEQQYRDDGWVVEDVRYQMLGYDARATKDGQEVYLEAKGTLGAGESVIVTRGEVNYASDHPGQCLMGIWSEMKLKADGSIDPDAGTFRIIPWNPSSGSLVAREYDWFHETH